MSYITKHIKEQNFKNFNELKTYFSKAPFFLDFKEDAHKYMIIFTDKSDFSLFEVRDCTGIILEKNTNKILHYSYPKCYDSVIETNSNDFLDLKKFIDNKDITISISTYFAGSNIKLYFHNHEWVISTSKTLDAGKSTWGSVYSFEELFVDCINNMENFPSYTEFLKSLDKCYAYTFIIQHPDLQTVIPSKSHYIGLLAKYNVITKKHDQIDDFYIKKDVSVQEIFMYYKTNSKTITENYIIEVKDASGVPLRRAKMLSKTYQDLKEIFGNQPDISIRFIELLKKNDIALTNQFTKTFKFPEVYIGVTMLLSKSVEFFFRTYKNKVLTETLDLKTYKPKYHNVLKKIRKLEKTDDIILKRQIKEIIMNCNPVTIVYIIT